MNWFSRQFIIAMVILSSFGGCVKHAFAQNEPKPKITLEQYCEKFEREYDNDGSSARQSCEMDQTIACLKYLKACHNLVLINGEWNNP